MIDEDIWQSFLNDNLIHLMHVILIFNIKITIRS
jgi:hypothetical protein